MLQKIYPILIEKTAGGTYSAFSPDFCTGDTGETQEEALLNAAAALQAYITYLVEVQEAIPTPTRLDQLVIDYETDEIVAKVPIVLLVPSANEDKVLA
jgi:predicted RNase H-like HicB family nuclease